MKTWFCIPSARPAEEADLMLGLWRERGYGIALMVTPEHHVPPADVVIRQKYPGWAAAVNILARFVLESDPQAEWIVSGGDDYEPDLFHDAAEIARDCQDFFGGTFGVMQPTGDRWGSEDALARAKWPDAPAYIDRIAGSPWMGRDFCERVNGGAGPMWSEYKHMFADEELQNVARKLGCFWQRRDLTQRHNHWGRKNNAQMSDCPEFLRWVNTREHWREAETLFRSRLAAGFPGHEVIARL